MDSKELRELMEAYTQVYAPQEEIEEAVKGESPERRKALAAERRAGIKPLSAKEGEKYASHKLSQMAYAKRRRMGEEVEEVDEAVKGADPEMRRAASAERRAGDRPLSKKVGDAHAANMARKIRFSDKVTKAKGHIPGYTYGEEVDIFDIVLEFLQSEGIAETIEEAQEIMVNELDAGDIDAIVEATYSAKAARAGKDIGKPGKAFAKIAASAGKRYGSKERGEKVAGAVLAKLRKQHEEVEIDEAQDDNVAQKLKNLRLVMDVEKSAGNTKKAEVLQKKMNKLRAKNPTNEEYSER